MLGSRGSLGLIYPIVLTAEKVDVSFVCASVFVCVVVYAVRCARGESTCPNGVYLAEHGFLSTLLTADRFACLHGDG